MGRRSLNHLVVRLVTSTLLIPLGILLIASGTMSLIDGNSQIPGGNSYRQGLSRLWGDKPIELPAQRVEPLIAATYGLAVVGFGVSLVGICAYLLAQPLGHADEDHNAARTNANRWLGAGLIVAASILASLSWDMAGLRWLWVAILFAGCFRLLVR